VVAWTNREPTISRVKVYAKGIIQIAGIDGLDAKKITKLVRWLSDEISGEEILE